ncbi:MAG: 16S rRNA (guanine(527)-N(7))-methyltransferase RsmG [Rhizobiales bacterium]|nr:16S rRNA (guanine(527)-N(7))-methyltransferase RsmG [Hyphomicrobiales bacterium]
MGVSDDAADVLRGFNVSRESEQKLRAFVDLLREWQAKMNLVSKTSMADVWRRHVADSLQLLRLMPQTPQVIADLGSGAGFPGLVLALAGRHQVHLYESIGKKALFLREAIRATGATAEVHQMRIEDIKEPPRVDFVTARALAPLDRLLALALPFLDRGATGLFMKGQDVDEELTKATKSWRIKFDKHPSLTDSRSVILAVTEARHG